MDTGGCIMLMFILGFIAGAVLGVAGFWWLVASAEEGIAKISHKRVE